MTNMKKKIAALTASVVIAGSAIAGAVLLNTEPTSSDISDIIVTFSDGGITYNIPKYSNDPYISLNGGQPIFEEFELKTEAYEEYYPLDSLGRCTLTSAIVCKETMPKNGEKRESISNVKPTGWIQAKYDCVPGKMLYNRCHLIGWQLTAENANDKNLITGTRYLNIDGMLDHENKVAEYVRTNDGYVAYQVTPIYIDNDLVAVGVQMEGYSIDDNGRGICFNIFCYNVQPGIEIDYATGASHLVDQINNVASLLFIFGKKYK